MFDESKHPRDEIGRFTDVSGQGRVYRQNANYGEILSDGTPAEHKRLRELGIDELREELQQELPKEKLKVTRKEKKGKSQEEFFGEEFKGVKGAEAIEKLLKEKRGHVKNAFERPEIGGIDLVWGDKNGGLFHTITRRDIMLERGTGHIGGIDMVKKIPKIIEKGEFTIDERDRPGFNYDQCRVAIRPTYDGEKLNWIVSAMEKLQ